MMDIVEDMPCEMRHIFHPTDFSPASMAAFGYALKLSLGMRSDLTIMHVDPARADPDFEDFPRVRATLIRWGLLKEGATKEDLLALGLGVRKIRAMDVVKEVIGELKTKGKVTRPWLGVGGKFVTEEIRELFLLPLPTGCWSKKCTRVVPLWRPVSMPRRR